MSNRRAVFIAILVITTISVLGFFAYAFSNKGGVPFSSEVNSSKEALIAADQKTIENLKMVQDLVVQYFKKVGRLPAMPGDLSLVSSPIPFEFPSDGRPVESIAGIRYIWHGDIFELCANFSESNKGMVTEDDVVWEHGTGEVCFRRDIMDILSQLTLSQATRPLLTSDSSEMPDDPAVLSDFFSKFSMCQPTSFRHTQQEKDDNLFRLFGTTVQRTYWVRVVGTEETDNSNCLVMMGYEISEQKSITMSGEAECLMNKAELRNEDATTETLAKFDQNDVIDNKLILDISNNIQSGTLNAGMLTQKEKEKLINVGKKYSTQTQPVVLTKGKEGYCISKN